ncbi:uncharacterized protein N7459_001314 [Penicillium hispanicum]|uniref:uncharacterized protein n=1 Tax=Penicillium hispanicum TaxID=1080232 RepID=UPI00253FD4D6|nr:uncharacterized protein N7459_001314 [Penicillium hispanicum]KAJ5595106.1 hypothetical protein N7459_001314 [Penicillium hispanicum]
MPPPVEDISDEESGDVPFKDAPEDQADGNKSEEDNEQDDGDDEGVYIVEKITEHNWLDDGSLVLLVKWKGWENPEDLTWEPEEGLKEGAEAVLAQYYKKIGGRPKKPAPKAGPGRKRKSMGSAKDSPAPADKTKPTEPKRRRRSTKAETAPSETTAGSENGDETNWLPKGKNWDKEVSSVDTIIRDQDNGGLYAFLLWNNGKRSRVAIESCYEKCPMQMLKFYEKHLVFKEG